MTPILTSGNKPPGRLGPLPLAAAAVLCAAIGLAALSHHAGHRAPAAVRPAGSISGGPATVAALAPTSTASTATATTSAPAAPSSHGTEPADNLESDAAVQQLLDSGVPHDLDGPDTAAAIVAAKAWLIADLTGSATAHVKAAAAYRGPSPGTATAVLIYSVPGDLQPSHRLVLVETKTSGAWTVLPPDHSGPQPTPR